MEIDIKLIVSLGGFIFMIGTQIVTHIKSSTKRDSKFETMGEQIGGIYKKLEDFEYKIDNHNKRIEQNNTRIAVIDKEIEFLRGGFIQKNSEFHRNYNNTFDKINENKNT